MSGPQWPGTPVNASPVQARTPQPIILPNAPQQHQMDVQDAGAANDATRVFLAQQENARKEAEWKATHNPDGSPRTDVGTPSEYQAKSAGFYGRMVQAEHEYNAIPAAKRDPRNTAGQTMHEWAPNVENQLPVWMGGNDANRQMSDQAALNFVRATLRQESGASINADEEAKQYKIFFPMPGDSEAVIAQKAAARQQAIAGFRISSGPLANQTDATLQPVAQKDDNGNPIVASNGAAPGGGPNGGGTHTPDMRGGLPVGTDITFGQQNPDNPFDRTAWLKANKGINPDQETWLVAFSNANRGNKNLSFEGVNAAFAQQGIPPLSRGSFAQFYKEAQDPSTVYAPFDTTDAEKQYKAGLQAKLTTEGFDPNSADSYADRAGRGATLGGIDELNGVRGFVDAAGRGDNPIDGYKDARNLDRMRYQQEQQAQGLPGTLTEIGGSLPTAFLGGPIGTVADAAKVGGVMGAVSGFNRGSGMGDSLRTAVTDGAIGAGLSAGLQAAAPYVGGAVRKVLGRDSAPVAAETSGVATGGSIADAPLLATEQAEIATLAKKATGWGPGARAAKKTLADKFAANPEAKAAAERLGIDLPPDILADNAQAQSLTGLSRSQVGSEAETAWKADAKRVADYADQAMTDLGGTHDLAQVSDDVMTRLKGTAQSLENKAGSLRDEVDAAIDPAARVEAPSLQETLAKTVNDYGGMSEAKAAMSPQEKELLAMLGEGETAKMPTYARLNRIRQDIGRAWTKGQGPWADVNQHQLGEYYHALQADQLAAVGQLGGAELAAKQKTANGLFSQMYDQRKQLQELFGKNIEGSLVPLLNRAVTAGAKGDTTALVKLLERLPEDTHGGALLSAIMAKSQTSAAHGGFSFANFTKLYRGLRENGPVFAKVAKAIGPKGTAVLNDLHVISSRMADAETRVLKTGKANQGMDAAMKAEGLVSGVLDAVASKGATGTGAVIGGAVGGPAGAAVGANLGASAKNAITGAGVSRLDKVHTLLSSPEFKATIARIADGEDTATAAKGLWNNIAFHNLGRSLGLLTPESRRAWLTRLTTSNPALAEGGRDLQRVVVSGAGPQSLAAEPDQSTAKPTTIPVPQ